MRLCHVKIERDIKVKFPTFGLRNLGRKHVDGENQIENESHEPIGSAVKTRVLDWLRYLAFRLGSIGKALSFVEI